MRVAPVSADLLVKLAAGAAVLVGLALVARSAREAAAQAAGAAMDAAGEAIRGVTPWNPDNVFYGGVNAAGGAIAGTNPEAPGRNADGSWSLGGWLYDVTH